MPDAPTLTGHSVITAAALQRFYPNTTIGSGGLWLINSGLINAPNSINAFGIFSLGDIGGGGIYNPAYALSPLMAKYMDDKIDDGLPLTGKVTAMRTFSGFISYPSSQSSFGCRDDSTPVQYAVSDSTAANALTCGLRIVAGF